MITNLIITAMLGILQFITRGLPNVVIDPRLTSAITTAVSYVNAADIFFPVYALVAVWAIFLITEGAIASYKVARWIYSKIPGIN